MKAAALTSLAQINRIEPDWARLLEAYPFGLFYGPVHFNFSHYGDSLRRHLKYRPYFIAVSDERDRICAVMPTFRRRLSNKLVFLNEAASEIVLDRDGEDRILAAVRTFLRERGLHLYSNLVYAGSNLQKLYALEGWPLEEWTSAFYVDLSNGYDAYLEFHGGRARQKLIAEERKADALGLELVMEDSPERFDDAFSEFLRLHLERWDTQSASLKDDRKAAAMRKFARHFMAHGQLFLSFVKVDGVNVSAYFGLKDRTTVYYLSSGRDQAYEKYGLGKIHMLKIFRWCCANGYRYFDFLFGETEFKRRFATTALAVYRNRP
jgi:hypothetical protein